MLFLLAERTGYPISYMLWELPLSVFCQAVHAYLYFEGARVRRKSLGLSSGSEDLAKLLGLDDKKG